MKNFYLRKVVAVAVALTLAVLPVFAQETLLGRMEQLRKSYGIHFIYDASLQGALSATRTPSTLPSTLPLEEALRQTFDGTAVNWQLRGNNVVLKGAPVAPKTRRYAISGHITDAETGETLIGAGILSGQTGAVTNEFGFYSLPLPAGRHQLRVAYIGYEQVVVELDLQRDTVLNFALHGNSALDAARIVARKDAGLQATFPGSVEVPLNQIRNVPALFGESDVIKTLQLLPGVLGGMEGFSGLYVRGGGPEENLVMLDGVPVYNMDHLLGIFSIFPPEAVKDVTLHKGSFPARYGGRISSVVDIRTNDGNMKETHGSLTVGLLNDRFHLEGPIVKDKLSYSLSARGMHTILLTPILHLALTNNYTNYFFYDLNGKLTWRASDKDRFYLNIYHGTDHGRVENEFEVIANNPDTYLKMRYIFDWGSTIGALRWNHVFSSRLFSNATLFVNRYGTNMDTYYKGPGSDDESYLFHTGILDIGARVDFDWTPAPDHLVKFGAEYIWHDFRPETIASLAATEDSGQNEELELGHKYIGSDASLYIEDNISLGRYFSINPGMRLTWFNTQGANYFSLQPRFAVKAALDNGPGVKAAYSRMAQYVHLLSSSIVALPLDLWVPITKDIQPVKADHYSAGFYYDGLPGWEFSVEGYWKEMFNLIEFKSGSAFLAGATEWENQIETGRGRSVGLEFFVQKNLGKTTGWISYTLSKTTRWFPGGTINMGEPFLYRYDRTHAFNVTFCHKFSEKVDASLSWVFASGSMMTLPQRATLYYTPLADAPKAVEHVDGYNNYRIPPSHRLNLGVNLRHRTRRGNEAVWNFSIYNVYNAMNPQFITPDSPIEYQNSEGGIKFKKITVLPILPAFSYTYNF